MFIIDPDNLFCNRQAVCKCNCSHATREHSIGDETFGKASMHRANILDRSPDELRWGINRKFFVDCGHCS